MTEQKLGILPDRPGPPNRWLVPGAIALSWGVPFLLALPGSLHPHQQGGFLADITAWVKYVLAVAALLIGEGQITDGLRTRLEQFRLSGLVPRASLPVAMAARDRAVRLRDSVPAALVLALIAYVGAFYAARALLASPQQGWAVTGTGAERHLTLAGFWSQAVSMPILIFLFLRILWLHGVWSQFMHRIARLPLRLVAHHPDKKGGLGFLSEYPNSYSIFIFAVSAVLAAVSYRQHELGTMRLASYGSLLQIGGLLLLVMFAFPLSAFTPPLQRLRRDTLSVVTAQATRERRKNERKTLGRNVVCDPDPDGAPEEEAPEDPTKLYDALQKLQVVLISRQAVVPLVFAALLPFAVLAASQMPYKEVWSVMRKLLLL